MATLLADSQLVFPISSVGDLKAEWILLKREVESLKKENLGFLKTQQELQNSTASFKGSMEKAALDTKALEMKVMYVNKYKNTTFCTLHMKQNVLVDRGFSSIKLALDYPSYMPVPFV